MKVKGVVLNQRKVFIDRNEKSFKIHARPHLTSRGQHASDNQTFRKKIYQARFIPASASAGS